MTSTQCTDIRLSHIQQSIMHPPWKLQMCTNVPTENKKMWSQLFLQDSSELKFSPKKKMPGTPTVSNEIPTISQISTQPTVWRKIHKSKKSILIRKQKSWDFLFSSMKCYKWLKRILFTFNKHLFLFFSIVCQILLFLCFSKDGFKQCVLKNCWKYQNTHFLYLWLNIWSEQIPVLRLCCPN